MTNIKEIALFTGYGIGFYPDKLNAVIKHSNFIEMRAHIFPKFIKEQISIDVTAEEAQKLYNNLGAGDSFRIGNIFYNAKMIFSMKFKATDNYIQTTNISKEEFKAMKPGEVISFKNKEFRKSKDDEYISVYELLKSKCQLVEVDINRPWTIDDYDGAEGIEYLDYDVVDEELNYCEKKGE